MTIKRLIVTALCWIADIFEHLLHVPTRAFGKLDDLIERLDAGSAAQAAAFLVAAVCAFLALPLFLFVGHIW